MEIKELAAAVLAATSAEQRTQTGNYYMVNINHPIAAALKRRFCEKNSINQLMPLSDLQRTEFELSLLQPSIRKMVEDICVSHVKENNERGEDHGDSKAAP